MNSMLLSCVLGTLSCGTLVVLVALDYLAVVGL